MSERQELIRNAVAFLQDSKTQRSSLAQRIQFLEAKGLSPAEINTAVKQSTMNQSSLGPSFQTPYSSVYNLSPHSVVYNASRQWDWRDYFITAVLSGSVVYGTVALFKKHLLPHLLPPTSTAYEDDRDAMSAHFDAAETILKELQAETASIRSAVEEQKENIDKATQDVETAVKDMRDGEARAQDELREIRDEVNTVRDMLPKMIEKNKESQNQSLVELQQELKSLKALLLNRAPNSSTTHVIPLPTLGKPSIPAWQLAGSEQGVQNTSNLAGPSYSPPSFKNNGKGKGQETVDTVAGTSS